MANTLTNLIPDLYAALDVLSQEPVAFIDSVARDSSADQVPLGATLLVPQAPPNTAGGDVTPAMTLPSAAYQTIGTKSFAFTKARYMPFSWWGSEQKAMNSGPGYLTLKQSQIAQAIRALRNEIESDIAAAIYIAASRAYGTAGTAPFATDLSDISNLHKILVDNGAPPSDRHLTINTTAGVKMRNLTQLTNVNQAGSADTLRRGVLLDIFNFMVRESAQVKLHTKGTGTNYVVNGTHAIGSTSIVVKTGANTIVPGDVIVFQNDTNKYVATTGLAAPGTFTIGAPGLLIQHVDSETVTIGNNYTANVGYTRNAVLLGTRLPDMPVEGDLASDSVEVTDPVTGLVYRVLAYPGDHMVTYRVEIAWGVAVIKPEHVALLLG